MEEIIDASHVNLTLAQITYKARDQKKNSMLNKLTILKFKFFYLSLMSATDSLVTIH